MNSRSHYESKIVQNGQVLENIAMDNINQNGNIIKLVNDKLHKKRYFYSNKNNRTKKFRKNLINNGFAKASMPNFYHYSKPVKIRSRKIGKGNRKKSKNNQV
jgi:hypothetical protein